MKLSPAEIIEALGEMDAAEVRETRQLLSRRFGIDLGPEDEPEAGAGVSLAPTPPAPLSHAEKLARALRGDSGLN